MTRDKFLKDFKFISRIFRNNFSVYWGFEVGKTLGLTYFELDRVSDELSFYFLKIFGNDSIFIGVSLSEYFLLPCLILGIWKSGNSFAGVGTQYTLKDTLNYLNFLRVKYLISDNDDDNYNGEIISYFYIQNQKFFIWRRQVGEEKISSIGDICYGIMTSGSTGVAKIIQVPWSCILPNVKELSEQFQVNEFDCIFQAAPYTFDPFFVELFLTLLSGCSLMIVSNNFKLNPSSLLEILFKETVNVAVQPTFDCACSGAENYFILNPQVIKKKTVTVLQMTPSIFKKWTYEKIKEVILSPETSLKVLVLGGEKFPEKILKLKSPENKTRIFNIYGITEISCWAFLQEVSHHPSDDKVPLGKPLTGIIYKISNDNELYIGSSTRVCLVDDEKDFSIGNPVFRNSGDVVEIKNEKLYYIGRSNQVVKKYGIKINLTRTEELFLSLSNLMKECFCIFDEINTKLGLFYVPKTTRNSEDYLVIEPQYFYSRVCQYPKELNDIEKPDYLIEIPRPPVNEHGKCDRKKLLQYLHSVHKPQVRVIDIRKTFIKIWGDVLGLEKNDIYSKSFSDLGGNSILGMEVINKLEDVGVEAPQNFITELLGGGNFETCLNCLVVEDSGTPRKRIKIDNEFSSGDDVEIVVRWKFDLGKCVDATPTVFTHQGVDKIVIGSHSSRLSCLVFDSGDEIWTISLGDRIESGFTVIGDGSRGFVGCYDHSVYCVSVSDGSILWKFQTEDMVKSTPCLSGDEQTVYLASYDKFLYCVSTSDGHLIGREKVSDGGIYCSGIVSSVLNFFYIGTLDGTCIALDTKTNLIKWKTKLKSPVFASPRLISSDSEIVFAEVLGIVHCITALDGTEVWNYKADGNIYSSPVAEESGNLTLITFGCHDSHLYCLQSGEVPELKWKQQLDSSVFARPVVSGSSTVCAATTKGFVYLCHFISGCAKARVKLSGEVFSSPVCRGNRLTIGCRDNHVYSLEILQIKG